MRRLLAFIGGVLSGGAIGVVVGLLFTPDPGKASRLSWRARWQRALEAGQAAAEARRAELEAQFQAMIGAQPAEDAETLPSAR
jgi:gas vesicle protein